MVKRTEPPKDEVDAEKRAATAIEKQKHLQKLFTGIPISSKLSALRVLPQQARASALQIALVRRSRHRITFGWAIFRRSLFQHHDMREGRTSRAPRTVWRHLQTRWQPRRRWTIAANGHQAFKLLLRRDCQQPSQGHGPGFSFPHLPTTGRLTSWRQKDNCREDARWHLLAVRTLLPAPVVSPPCHPNRFGRRHGSDMVQEKPPASAADGHSTYLLRRIFPPGLD